MSVALTTTSTLFLAGSGLLLLSGVRHSGHQSAFAATLSAHRLLPSRVVSAMSRGVAGAELLVGASAGFAAVRWQLGGGLQPVALVLAQAGLYLLFLAYLIALVWLRPGSDCGCTHRGVPVNALTVGRAAILAGVAFALPALVAAEGTSISLSTQKIAISWLCSASLILPLSVVPQALATLPTHRSKAG